MVNFSDISTTIDIYDTETDSWSVKQMSASKKNIGVAALNDRIYLAGGQLGSMYLDEVEIIDLETDERTIEQLSIPRMYVTAVATSDQLFFATGINGSENYNVIDILSVDNISTTNTVTSPTITVFPNPATHFVRVHPYQARNHYQLYNSKGQLVKTVKGEVSIDISDLPIGVYYLKFVNQSNSLQKIVKQGF